MVEPTAIYRRWRSQRFDELIGQEPIVTTLRNAVAADKIAHAYLFVGPRRDGQDLHGSHPGQGDQLHRPGRRRRAV